MDDPDRQGRPEDGPSVAPGAAEYRPPQVEVLGDVAKLTRGATTAVTDGIGPGSLVG